MSNPPLYYSNLKWKPWNDNDGQNSHNKVDYAKIIAAQLIPSAHDASGKNLYIARQVSADAEAGTDFDANSTAALVVAGEYHPANNTHCGRMINMDGKLEVLTHGYEVLSGEQVSLSFANYKTVSVVQWVEYTSTDAQTSDLSTCLQVGVNSSKEAVYACRFIAKTESNTDDGYALGTYTVGDEAGLVPWSKDTLKSETFQLLQVVPATLKDVRTLMVNITWACKAESEEDKYLNALNLQPGTASYFLTSEVAADGFNLSPSSVISISPSDLPTEANYLNKGFAAVDAAGGIVIGLRGTMNIGDTSEGSVYDWVNNFIATQQYVAGLGHIHPGFYYAALALLGLEENGKGLYAFAAAHMTEATEQDPVSITVCGHSKGGAMAQIIALLLKNKYANKASISVCTFGAPMPGGSDFVANLDTSIPATYHYINKADPVPWLPFSNEAVAFGEYLANLPFMTVFGTITASVGTIADTSIIQSHHPTLTSGKGGQWISLFLQAIFGDPSLVTTLFPSIKKWLITEAEITEVKALLQLLDPIAMKGSTDATTPEQITALFRHAFTLSADVKLAGSTVKEALSQPGFDALLLGSLVLMVAEVFKQDWISYLRDLPLYSSDSDDNPNYAAFVNDILPLVESFSEQVHTLWGTAQVATTEGATAMWESRYARSGNVVFIAPSVWTETGLVTVQEVSPYMSFTQFLTEFSQKNIDDGNTKTQTPIDDHGAYPEVITLL